MNTDELNEALEKLDWKCAGGGCSGNNNKGVFAADLLPPCNLLLRKGNYMIVNTDPVNESGTHWLAVYCPDDGTVEVFDSYGFDLETYPTVKRFLVDRCRPKLIRSMEGGPIQEENSDVCGAHCIFYLAMRMCHGLSMEDIVNSVYTNNLLLNDCLALHYLCTIVC